MGREEGCGGRSVQKDMVQLHTLTCTHTTAHPPCAHAAHPRLPVRHQVLQRVASIPNPHRNTLIHTCTLTRSLMPLAHAPLTAPCAAPGPAARACGAPQPAAQTASGPSPLTGTPAENNTKRVRARPLRLQFKASLPSPSDRDGQLLCWHTLTLRGAAASLHSHTQRCKQAAAARETYLPQAPRRQPRAAAALCQTARDPVLGLQGKPERKKAAQVA